MATTTINQGTITKFQQDTHLLTWIEAFLVDRKAQGLSIGTLKFYQKKLKLFTDYCDTNLITQITEITSTFLRDYIIYLEVKGHNPGGRHACYRALKTFLYWWEREMELDDWSNPIRKVKPPKLNVEILEPVKLNVIKSLIDTCDKEFHGLRDKAIFLTLVDTGIRARELIEINLEDFEYTTGRLLIRHGKGGKYRIVFMGKKSRRAVRAYLRKRADPSSAFWVTKTGERLTYWGVRQIVRRRAVLAKVPAPALHSFRRAFALNMLRAGVDIYSIQLLMGHADLQVLRRYLKLTNDDLHSAHQKGSPVDNAGF